MSKIPTAKEFAKKYDSKAKNYIQGIDDPLLHQIMNDYLKPHLQALSEEIKEKAEIGHYACGDPMTCGCMGTCEAPYSAINKSSIDTITNNYLKENQL